MSKKNNDNNSLFGLQDLSELDVKNSELFKKSRGESLRFKQAKGKKYTIGEVIERLRNELTEEEKEFFRKNLPK